MGSVMKRYRLLFLGWVALSARAEITEQQIEADCLKIASYSAQGGDHYRRRDYAKARELYEQQAAWSESCQLDDARIATAYNNVALTYIREGDYLKARAWLQLMPDDSKSVHNLGLIEDKLPAVLAGVSASAEGEYWQYAGKSLWNVIRIGREGRGHRLDFEGYYPGLMAMYYGPNIGEFSASLDLSSGHARYSMAEGEDGDLDCVYDFSAGKDALLVSRLSGSWCGFGHNVSAEGKYVKVGR